MYTNERTKEWLAGHDAGEIETAMLNPAQLTQAFEQKNQLTPFAMHVF